MKTYDRFRIQPHSKVKLTHIDPGETGDLKNKQEGQPILKKHVSRLRELQDVLYAEGKHALLIILQAMDAAGKDGTIRHVFHGFNPQGTSVVSFKVPSSHEAAHDFLWRIHEAVPGRGDIGIFNRSHYEDVLVVRVHNLVPKKVWSRRYEQINDFEQMLFENGVTIVKFFLHISKDEQKKRLEARLNDAAKHWKVNPQDLEERKYWDDYMAAYEDVLSKCSAPHAPWYVVPANKKWFRNVVISQVLIETMEALDMKYPTINAEKLEELRSMPLD